MQMVFQLLVLGFTAYVWWLARRDLSQRAAELSGPAISEWARLQETVQTLVDDLERRATDAEQRVAAAERRMAVAEASMRSFDRSEMSPASPVVSVSETVIPDETRPQAAEHASHDERYAPVYALADAGVTETAEIARRTGLGHGEIALVLGLYTQRHPH